MLKNREIDALCNATEKFVVETLCPMVEEFTGEKSGKNFESYLYATLRTVALNLHTGQFKFAKSGGKFVVLDGDDPKPEENGNEEEENPCPEGLAEDMSDLITKVIKTAKKHSKSRADFDSSLSAAALTIVQAGGKGSLLGLLFGLRDILEDEI